MTVINMWDDQGCRSCCNYGTLLLISCSSNEFSRLYVTIAINWDPHLWLEIWKFLKHFDFKNEPHSNNTTYLPITRLEITSKILSSSTIGMKAMFEWFATNSGFL
jgi:hypothetical protein